MDHMLCTFCEVESKPAQVKNLGQHSDGYPYALQAPCGHLDLHWLLHTDMQWLACLDLRESRTHEHYFMSNVLLTLILSLSSDMQLQPAGPTH